MTRPKQAAAAASLPVPLPTRARHLGESIEGEECSSRTASEDAADLSRGDIHDSNSNPLLSSLSAAASAAASGDGEGGSADGGSPSPTPPSRTTSAGGGAVDQASPATSPVPTASSLAALARAATASTPHGPVGGEEGLGLGFLRDENADGAGATTAAGVYCSSPEESDFGDDEGGEGGEEGEGFVEGGGSQKGFWYGEGGGASALEAAMGQWGGDLEEAAAAAAGGGGGGGGVGDVDDDTGSDTTAPNVAVLLQEASAHGLPKPVAAGPAGAAAGEGEDESWEIVNPPGQWEVDAAAVSGWNKRTFERKMENQYGTSSH